jgi:hypothetical protein
MLKTKNMLYLLQDGYIYIISDLSLEYPVHVYYKYIYISISVH